MVELATSGSFLEALAHIENDAVLLSHLVCVTLALERVQLLEAALVLAALDELLGDVLAHGGALLGLAERLAERLELAAGRLEEGFRCDAKRLREVLRSTLELVKLTLLGFVRLEVCRSLVGAVHWRGGAHDPLMMMDCRPAQTGAQKRKCARTAKRGEVCRGKALLCCLRASPQPARPMLSCQLRKKDSAAGRLARTLHDCEGAEPAAGRMRVHIGRCGAGRCAQGANLSFVKRKGHHVSKGLAFVNRPALRFKDSGPPVSATGMF